MIVHGTSQAGFAEAVEQALQQVGGGREPWTVVLTRAWVETGGVVGRVYCVEMRADRAGDPGAGPGERPAG